MSLSRSVKIAMKIAEGYKYFHSGALNLFFDSTDFPRCAVEKVDDNKFTIYCFKKFSVLMQDFLNMQSSEEAYETYMDVFKLNYIFKEKGLFELAWITNQKAIKDSIEKNKIALSKYFSNDVTASKMLYINAHKEYLAFEKTVNKANAAKILYKEIKMPTNQFEDFYGPVDFTGIKGVSQFNYRKWNVTLDDKAASKEDVEKLLEAVESKMGKFRYLCYGGVEVKKTLENSNLLADYYGPTDSMRIKTKKHADNDFILSFIHELGHRLYQKVLNGNQQMDVEYKYDRMKHGDRIELKDGNVFETRDGYVLKVTGYMSNGFYKLEVVDNSKSKKKKFAPGMRLKIQAPHAKIVKTLNGKQFIPEDSNFPSMYAKTNHEEFFSECFSYWLMGKLNKPLSDWLKELL